MSYRKKAITSFFWSGLEQFGTQLASLIVAIVLARLLLPADFGLIGMILVFVALGKSLLDAGLSQSLVRSKEVTDIEYASVFYFNLCMAFLLYAAVYALAPLVSSFYEQPSLAKILRWYSLVIIIHAFGAIQRTRIVKLLRFKLLFKIHIPAIVISGVTGILLAMEGYGVWSLVAAALVQSLLLTLLLWRFGRWIPPFAFSFQRLKHHFNYGSRLLLAGIIDTAYSNAYAVIIGKYFTVGELGFYNRADSLKQIPVQNVGSVLNKVSFPLFAAIQDDAITLRKSYTTLMKAVMFVIAPVLLISAALAQPLFRALLTEKWLPAAPYYQILCFAGLLYPINAYNLNVLKVKGRSDLFLKLELLKKGMGVLIIMATLPFGIIPLLWGSVAVSICAFFINTHYSASYINYSTWAQLKDLLPILAVAALVGVGVYLMDANLGDVFRSNWLRIFCFSLMGGILYVVLIRIFQNKTWKETVQLFRNKQ